MRVKGHNTIQVAHKLARACGYFLRRVRHRLQPQKATYRALRSLIRPRRISLRLDGGATANSVTLGPTPWCEIFGSRISCGPNVATLVTSRRDERGFDLSHFPRIKCNGIVMLIFVDDESHTGESFGPFSEVVLLDGILRTEYCMMAEFIEESELWHCYPTENVWPVIVLKAA
jgi:hypothetical protein